MHCEDFWTPNLDNHFAKKYFLIVGKDINIFLKFNFFLMHWFNKLFTDYQGHIKDTKKKKKIGLERSSMQQTDSYYQFIGSLHECKKVYLRTKALLLSGIRAWIKQFWMKKKKERQRSGSWWKERLFYKNLSMELKRGLLRHSSG